MQMKKIVAAALVIGAMAPPPVLAEEKLNDKLIADIKALPERPRKALEDWIASCHAGALEKKCTEATRTWFALFGEVEKKPTTDTVNGALSVFANAGGDLSYAREKDRLQRDLDRMLGGSSPSETGKVAARMNKVAQLVRDHYRASMKQ